jgi:SAM-dependent methyltransferase
VAFSDLPDELAVSLCESGVGLEGGSDPLLALDRERFHSYLDIGCGRGWILYLATHAFGWRARGLDTSVSAKLGRRCLGARIDAGLLDDDTDLGERIDLIYACEVIEYVIDPRPWLRGIVNHLELGGVFDSRTPNAAAIRPDTDEQVVLMVIAPGTHPVLYSATSVADRRHEVGFTHAHVAPMGDATLSAAASMEAFDWHPNAIDSGAVLVPYLERRLPELEPGPNRTGFIYTLANRHFSVGRWADADALLGDSVPAAGALRHRPRRARVGLRRRARPRPVGLASRVTVRRVQHAVPEGMITYHQQGERRNVVDLFLATGRGVERRCTASTTSR